MSHDPSKRQTSRSIDLIESMNQYYDARAPWHDENMGYESPEKMERLLAPIVAVVEPLIRGRDVIEVACGTGNWTQFLAKRARSVVGTDVSEQALAIARHKVAGLNNTTLVCRSAYELNTLTDRFDVAFAADWWSHIPIGAIPRFLESLSPVLRPSATVIVLDMSMRPLFQREPSRHDADGNRVSRRFLPDGASHDVVKNFPSERDLRDLLEGHARNLRYYSFDDLKRWLVVYEQV